MGSWFETKGILDRVRELLAEHSCEGYLVGGYVRDQLLGRGTHDVDLAVRREAIGLAREAANRLGGAFVLLDEERETARVVLRDASERYYLDFAGLRGDGLAADLSRRDFTVNAMAVDAQDRSPDPELMDPFGGRRDLERGLLRAVSDVIFLDDPLRLLRAVRLAAELQMTVESHTEQLMYRAAGLITNSSPERARDELCRILGTSGSGSSLRYLDQVGILSPLIPELDHLRGVEQPPPHHEDPFDHSLATVGMLDRVFEMVRFMYGRESQLQTEGLTPEDDMLEYLGAAVDPFSGQLSAHLEERVVDERSRLMLLKLAGLLHDSGKGTTGKVDGEGRIRFFGHAVEGGAVAARVLRRLHFGNREVRLVQMVIRHHMRPLHLAQQERITRRAIHRFFRDTGGAGVDVLLHSLGDNLVIRQRGDAVVQGREVCDTVGLLLRAYYEEYAEVIQPPPLISGKDLISHCRVKPGPAIGRLLREVQEAQVAGEVRTREEALHLAGTLLAEGE